MKNNEKSFYNNVKIKSTDLDKRARERKNRNKGEFKDINFKKSLGQNFLSNKELLAFIIDSAEVNKDDCVLEIGAGAGSLTEQLCLNAKKVLSYEIDKSLVPKLNSLQAQHSNLEMCYEDFMKCDVNTLFQEETIFKVVANIPYYITTPIIFKLMEISNRISNMIFMVQKEVAERFSAKQGCKEYGVTTIVLQSIADVSYERTLPKEFFIPMPKVDSALVKIALNKNKFDIKNYEKFSELVHNSFAMRRKTLMNNLLKSYSFNKELLEKYITMIGYTINVRPEEISVENYIKLSNYLF